LVVNFKTTAHRKRCERVFCSAFQLDGHSSNEVDYSRGAEISRTNETGLSHASTSISYSYYCCRSFIGAEI
jgi:hypothetical protein